jgi:Beta-lactamase enzyme family
MKFRRIALCCLPLSVIVAVAAGIALSRPVLVSWGPASAHRTASASPTVAPAANIAAANIAAADQARNAAADQAHRAAADQARRAATASDLAQRKASLTAALSAMAAAQNVHYFAVAVLDHKTGVSYTFGADDAFETASVVKVEILAALLLRARKDGHGLTAGEQSLANVMIRQSDNAAATALWRKIGDAAGLRAANHTLGLTETVPGTGGWWGRTRTTVSDQVRLLDAIANPAGPLGDSNQVILNLMGRVVADQNWGVSAAANSGESTVLKNGWMPRTNMGGRWTVNSVGRITGTHTDVTLAVMSRGHATLSHGIAFVENIARLSRTQLAW